jgi:hypothetical protein
MTYVFFTILLFIGDQMGKIYLSIRTHPKDSSWFIGLYAGTYVISCSLMITGLEPIIRFDGVFIVIYLVSILANLISLWQISNWYFPKRVQRLDLDRDIARYIKDVKELHKPMKRGT